MWAQTFIIFHGTFKGTVSNSWTFVLANTMKLSEQKDKKDKKNVILFNLRVTLSGTIQQT